jgi:hypothetical protein
MFVYYFKLWIYHPEEMLDIYKGKFMDYKTLKFARSMKSERMTSFNAPFLGLIALFTYLVNTSWKAWAVLLLSFSMLAVFHRRMHTVGLFLALTIVGACLLLLLESVIIIHSFTITHCSVVNLLFFMVVFYYVQMAVSYLQKHQVFHTLNIRLLSRKPQIS